MSSRGKAIRDHIPDIIKGAGGVCHTRRLADEEFLHELEKKLTEEVNEYLESRNIEELADVTEVIHRILELSGHTVQELEEIRLKKRSERGGFDENLFLESA